MEGANVFKVSRSVVLVLRQRYERPGHGPFGSRMPGMRRTRSMSSRGLATARGLGWAGASLPCRRHPGFALGAGGSLIAWRAPGLRPRPNGVRSRRLDWLHTLGRQHGCFHLRLCPALGLRDGSCRHVRRHQWQLLRRRWLARARALPGGSARQLHRLAQRLAIVGYNLSSAANL